jgi:hypothetical protein
MVIHGSIRTRYPISLLSAETEMPTSPCSDFECAESVMIQGRMAGKSPVKRLPEHVKDEMAMHTSSHPSPMTCSSQSARASSIFLTREDAVSRRFPQYYFSSLASTVALEYHVPLDSQDVYDQPRSRAMRTRYLHFSRVRLESINLQYQALSH